MPPPTASADLNSHPENSEVIRWLSIGH